MCVIVLQTIHGQVGFPLFMLAILLLIIPAFVLRFTLLLMRVGSAPLSSPMLSLFLCSRVCVCMCLCIQPRPMYVRHCPYFNLARVLMIPLLHVLHPAPCCADRLSCSCVCVYYCFRMPTSLTHSHARLLSFLPIFLPQGFHFILTPGFVPRLVWFGLPMLLSRSLPMSLLFLYACFHLSIRPTFQRPLPTSAHYILL